MTEQELRALKPGDAVEYKHHKGGWRRARIKHIHPANPLYHRATVRPDGLNKIGFPLSSVYRYAEELRHPVNLEPTVANVYADWLDDEGEHHAAEKLRKAFPLGPEKEPAP